MAGVKIDAVTNRPVKREDARYLFRRMEPIPA
jgi:hypothetical protein